MSKNSVTQRFIWACEHILAAKKVKNKSELAKALGIFPQTYNKIEEGLQKLSIELLETAVKEYSINPLYLLYGKQPMFADPDLLKVEEEAEAYLQKRSDIQDTEGNVIIVPYKVSGGVQRFDEQLTMEMQRIQMPFLPYPELYAFEVHNDSMVKPDGEGFHERDWVYAIKTEISNGLDISDQIDQGHVYVFLNKEGFTIKRLYKIKGIDVYELHPDNPVYDILKTSSTEWHALFRVKAKLGFRFPKGGDLENKVRTLEEEMQQMKFLIQELVKTDKAKGRDIEIH